MHMEFSLPALPLIHDFLSSRSKEQKLMKNIFQGSILCPLFFSIFLVDLFSVIEAIRYKIEDITSYADNTTPFIVEENIENIIVS